MPCEQPSSAGSVTEAGDARHRHPSERRITGGDPLTTAEVLAIFQRFVDIEFDKDVEARRAQHGDDLADGFQLPRTPGNRAYDALVAIFRAANRNITPAAAAEPLVNIVIDADTWGRMLLAAGLTTSTDLDGRPIDPFTGLPTTDASGLLDDLDGFESHRCETTNGVALHTHDVLRAALAGHVRRTVVDAQRVVIDMGRQKRLFAGNARRAAKLLIRRCEHAGCELPAEWCDVDHNDEWDRDLGATDQANAAIQCRAHNNDKHRERWRTRRATNGCSYTIRHDGTIILPIGARPPDFGDDAAESDDPDPDPGENPAEFARLTTLARNRVAALAH